MTRKIGHSSRNVTNSSGAIVAVDVEICPRGGDAAVGKCQSNKSSDHSPASIRVLPGTKPI